MKRLGGLTIALLITAAVAAFVVLMGSLIYPGALKWTSSSVCTDSSADPVVVRDTYQTEPGETSTNFTLYCVGSRGEIEDAGFGKPVGILILWVVAATAGLVIVLFIIGNVRRLISGEDAGGGSSDIYSPDGYGYDDFVADSPQNSGSLADPIEGYDGQPPLIS